MPPVQPLRQPPIGFAHRGARAHARENTLEAFDLAVRLGATGIESDVWLTADGVPVLDHDGVVGRLRRMPMAKVASQDLPGHVPTLAALYQVIPSGMPVSLDVKDPGAFEATVAVAEEAGAARELWLCHPDWELVASWRSRSDAIRLVNSTRINRMRDGPERRAMTLRHAGIDAVNLHESDWTAGLTTLFHRFGVECFGWGAQLERILDRLLAVGVDAVYSDHVDRMVDALDRNT